MSLIAWFPLNGNINNQGIGSYTATSGSSTYGNGLTATKSLTFSGNSMSIDNPFIGLSEWSLSMWYKANSPGTWSDIFTFNGDYGRIEFSAASGASLTWYHDSTEYGDLLNSGTTIAAGLSNSTWYHIILTYDNGTTAVYLNGVQKVQQTGKRNYTADVSKLYFACRADLGNYAAINMNDIRCYDHCLSTQEINNLSKGLVAQYSNNINHNLAVNSKNNYTYSGFNDSGNSTTGAASWVANAGTYNGMTVCKWAQGKYGYNTVGPYFNTNAKFGATFVVGETYTISAYVRADTSGTLNSNGLGEGQSIQSGNYKVTSTWTRVWSTFKATKASHNCCFYSQASSSTATGYFYMCGVKIERGEHVTEWANDSNISIIKDMSGNGNHGKNTGCYLSTPVKVGLLSIDTAASGYVTLPSLYLNNSFTICGWIYFKAFATWARVFDFGTATEGSDYDIGMAISDSNNGIVTVFGRSGSGASLPDTNITTTSLNTWNHFAIVISGTSLKVYWNGSLAQSWTTPNAIGNQLYTLNYLGKSNWSADGYMQEHINDFRIYNTALSADDISDMYNTKSKIDNGGNMYCFKLNTDTYTGNMISATGVSEIADFNNDYEELEYIEATGTQWINTGIREYATWTFDIQFMVDGVRRLMGYGPSSNEYWGVQADNTYGIGKDTNILAGNRDIIIHDYEGTEGGLYQNGTKILNTNPTGSVTAYDYQLFCIGGLSEYCCKAKLYSCKCTVNGILRRDFIPAKRKSDRAIGLLDKVEGKFYTRSGTGTFLAKSSSEMKVFGGYQRLEYAQSSGAQYIDTGVKVDLDNDKFEIDFQANDASGNYFIAGSGYGESGKIWIYNYPSGSCFSCYATDTGGTQRQFYGYAGPDAYFHNIVYDQRKLICDGTQTADNSSYTFGTNPYNFGLFNATNATGYFSKAKISKFKLWKSGDLVRDMIPVKRLSDGAVGMFDRVGMKFYGNSGTGSLTAGTVLGEYIMLVANNIYEGMGASVVSKDIEIPALVEYKLSISTSSGASISINRTSSNGGSTGTLSNGAVIYDGDVLTITPSVSTGYNLSTFTINGTSYSGSQTITVGGNVTVAASGAVKSYSLSISAGAGSSVTVNRTSSPLKGASTGNLSSGASVYHGDVLTISRTAGAAYDITSFTVNSSSFGSGSSHTVASNVSVSCSTSVKTFKFVGYTDNTGGIFSTYTIKRNSSPYGGGSTGTIFDLTSGQSTVLTDITLYYGDELSFSGTYSYMDGTTGGKPNVSTGAIRFVINGVYTYNYTVTDDVAIEGEPGGSSGGSGGTTTGSWTLTPGTFYVGMSGYSGLSVPSGLQAACSAGCKISGTINWQYTFVNVQTGSSSFSNVSINGGTISWEGGTVSLSGYKTNANVPYISASGLTGSVNMGSMVGYVDASVTSIVVTSYS